MIDCVMLLVKKGSRKMGGRVKVSGKVFNGGVGSKMLGVGLADLIHLPVTIEAPPRNLTDRPSVTSRVETRSNINKGVLAEPPRTAAGQRPRPRRRRSVPRALPVLHLVPLIITYPLTRGK